MEATIQGLGFRHRLGTDAWKKSSSLGVWGRQLPLEYPLEAFFKDLRFRVTGFGPVACS